jgi:energy-coupling factor transport system ATP-binding protein
MSDFIKTEHLSFVYDDGEADAAIPALSDVNITLQKGEYVAILGHNGSGKSTLAKLLNLILLPTDGEIFVDGMRVTSDGLDAAEEDEEDALFAIRRKVGMVFQNPDNQLVATMVEEDVAFGPENLGVPREEIRVRVDEALRAVGMQGYERHAPHRLSGGQKQRVAVAGVIAMRPDCIIFDESTAMLDPRGRHEVMDTMERLNREEGITILHITHYMEEAARADRVIVINDGRVLLDGTPAEVFSRVDDLRSVGLDVPQGTELLHELRLAGWDLPEGLTAVEDCVAALLAHFGKEGV